MPTACRACGFENRDDAAFCGECGQSLAVEQTCAVCGRATPAERRFCDGCGTSLETAAGTRERVPSSYTPRHLADEILAEALTTSRLRAAQALYAEIGAGGHALRLAEELETA